MASGHPEQARHGVFGNVDEPGGGPYPTSFIQMIDDGFRLFLRDFGVEQGSPTWFRNSSPHVRQRRSRMQSWP